MSLKVIMKVWKSKMWILPCLPNKALTYLNLIFFLLNLPEFLYIEVWFTDRNSKRLEDKISVVLVIN